MLRRLLITLSLAAACLGTVAATDASAQPRGMQLGFIDGGLASVDNQQYATGLAHARDAGATIWRIFAIWATVAPTAPPNAAAASDPGWPGYNWSTVDRVVTATAAAGLEPVLVPFRAPAWAEGPNRPSTDQALAGTWRPSAPALQAFATALARRYSGTYADATGQVLPRVRFIQAWNEPNLAVDVTPQYTRKGGRWVPASPGIYRSMLNAVYRGVKAAVPSDVVITAGTAPYGDLDKSSNARIPPVAFWRSLLCVQGRTDLRSTRCGQHVSFDALAHHPYPIGPPRRRARNPDDAVVPDIGKITRVLRVAQRAGTVLPRGTKPIWATEISWDSTPDPDGLSLADQARYLEGALYTLWKQGVRYVTWFNLRDEAKGKGWDSTYQSGIFTRGDTVADDTPKPSYTAFRFPFTAYRTNGVAELWGMAPQAGPVAVQALVKGTWHTAASLTAGSDRVFVGRLRVGRGTKLRAVSGADESLTWTTF